MSVDTYPIIAVIAIFTIVFFNLMKESIILKYLEWKNK